VRDLGWTVLALVLLAALIAALVVATAPEYWLPRL